MPPFDQLPMATDAPTGAFDNLPLATDTPTGPSVSEPDKNQAQRGVNLDSLPMATDTPTEPPQPQQTQQPAGFFQSLGEGVTAAIREGGRVATGQTFTDQAPEAPQDRTFFGRVGYGLGHGFPTLGAGLAGGAVGSMAGGPVGAAVGAATGVGGMSFLQELVPAYDAARAAGKSHDDAVSEAVTSALASGAIGAATAPLFNIPVFRNAIGNLLFHGAVTTPAVGTAGRVVTPYVTGNEQPSGEQLLTGAGEDVAAGLGLGFGMHLGERGVARVLPRTAPAPEAAPGPAPAETPVPPQAAAGRELPLATETPQPSVPPPQAAPEAAAPAPQPVLSPRPEEVPPAAPVPPPAPEAVPPPVQEPPRVEPGSAVPTEARPLPEAVPPPAAPTPEAEARTGQAPSEPSAIVGSEPARETPIVETAPPAPEASGVEPSLRPPTPTEETTPHDTAPVTPAEPQRAPEVGTTGVGDVQRPGEPAGGGSGATEVSGAADHPPPQPEETAGPVQGQPFGSDSLPRLNGATTNSAEYSRFSDQARQEQRPVYVHNEGGFWRRTDTPPEPPFDYAVFHPDKPPEYVRQQDMAPAPRTDFFSQEQPVRDNTRAVQPENQSRLDDVNFAIPRLQQRVTELEGKGERIRPRETVELQAKQQQLANAIRTRDQLTQPPEQLPRRAQPTRPRRPTPGQPPEFRDYQFNDGTSVYEKAFHDAGYDPHQAVNFPIVRQNAILTEAVQKKFGFRDVTVTGDKHVKETRDTLLDLYRATQDGMAALSMPHDMASLMGKIGIQLEPYKPGKGYYGMYDLRTRTIHLVGRANSFGHEWTHALDHELVTMLQMAPNRLQLLSRYSRNALLDPKDPLQARFAKLINTMFYDQGELAAARLHLLAEAQKTNPQGRPTAQARAAQEQLRRLEAGGSRMAIKSSEYRRMAQGFGDPRYWASEFEMLARAGEAYIARRMEAQGFNPRGIVMPDEAYLNDIDRRLRETYPKQQERTDIFNAFDDLFQGLRDTALAGSPAGAASHDFGAVDPANWTSLVSGTKQGPSLARPLKQTVENMRNMKETLAKTSLFDPTRPQNERKLHKRLMMDAKWFAYTRLGMLEEIIHAAPKAAQPFLQEIRDHFGSHRGTGRYVGQGYEEQWRQSSRQNTHFMTNAFANHGLFDLTALENDMLDRFMTTGETRYQGEPIPNNIQALGRDLRYLANQTWEDLNNRGYDIGYVRDRGYVPIIYDHVKVHANQQDFVNRASQVYKIAFNRDVGLPGENPQALYERWRNLPREVKDMTQTQRATPAQNTLPANMRELGRNLREQARVEAQLQVSPNDPALIARRDALVAAARDLAEQYHDPLGDFIALKGAEDWRLRVDIGHPGDFLDTGPSGNFLAQRELPPESDQIMRPYMDRDMKRVWSHYFEKAARKIAFADHFGADGGEFTRLMEAASDAAYRSGERFHDSAQVAEIVNSITGRNASQNNRAYSGLSNFIHALGAVRFMGRAAWSSLNEPAVIGMVHGDAGAALRSYLHLFGGMMHTKSSYERAQLADFLGVTTSRLTESIMTDRVGADYADSPRIANFMQHYYRANMLTQLTNGIRRANLGTNDWLLKKYSQDLLRPRPGTTGQNAALVPPLTEPAKWGYLRDDAVRMFNEMGVPPSLHEEFARWMLAREGLPSVDELKNDPMRSVYATAQQRLSDWASQDPYKGDRPMLADNSWGRNLFQLQLYNNAFQRNIIDPLFRDIGYSFTRTKERATKMGAGGAEATMRGLGRASATAVAHYVPAMAALYFATLMWNIPRSFLFSRDQWDKHAKEGDLSDWLVETTMSRSGMNGTLDPLMQVINGLKYTSDLSGLFEGASMSAILNDMSKVIMGVKDQLGSEQPPTNTSYHNMLSALYNIGGIPTVAWAATRLASLGPATAPIGGAALQYFTTPNWGNFAADLIAGEKGTKLPKPYSDEGLQGLDGEQLPGLEEDKLPGLEDEAGAPGTSSGTLGGVVPVGMLDDFIVPFSKVLSPAAQTVNSMLPTPLKVGGAAVLGAGTLLHLGAPYRNAPQPSSAGVQH